MEQPEICMALRTIHNSEYTSDIVQLSIINTENLQFLSDCGFISWELYQDYYFPFVTSLGFDYVRKVINVK